MVPETPDRRSLLLALGGALGAGSVASAQASSAPAPSSSSPATPPSEAEAAELPDLVLEEDRSSRLTTPVSIDGRGPFEFVVDTGANRTTLSTELAAELALPAGPIVSVHGVAGPMAAPTARIGSVRVGELETRGVLAPTFPRATLGAAGLLGIDVFRDRRVELDFSENVLRLGSPRGRAPTARRVGQGFYADVTVPARQRSGQLMIFDADAHGRSIVCFIDSGASTCIGNEAMFQLVSRRNTSPRFQPAAITVRSATGQTVSGRAADVGDLRVGALEFSDFAMVFAPLHTFEQWGLGDRPAMLFGIDVLRMFASVALDFARPIVTFRTAAERRARPGSLRHWVTRIRPSVRRP